jgi:hypothetical protein
MGETHQSMELGVNMPLPVVGLGRQLISSVAGALLSTITPENEKKPTSPDPTANAPSKLPLLLDGTVGGALTLQRPETAPEEPLLISPLTTTK